MNRILPLTLILLAALDAMATVDGTLSLSPAVVMLSGDYGQSTTQTISLMNGTSRPFSFDLVAQDVVSRNGKREFVGAGSIAGSIAATAVFSQKQVTVAPGERVTVDVTLTVPQSTQQRAVVAVFRGTNTVMSGHVPITASLGTLLTFSMSDGVDFSAQPLEVRPQSPSANLTMENDCTNSGTEPLVAKGVMAVLDHRGSLVGRSPLAPQRLLPGESAKIVGEYAGELDPGTYRIVVTYDFEGHSLTRSAEVVIP